MPHEGLPSLTRKQMRTSILLYVWKVQPDESPIDIQELIKFEYLKNDTCRDTRISPPSVMENSNAESH